MCSTDGGEKKKKTFHLGANGNPRPRTTREDGAVLMTTRRRKRERCPELLRPHLLDIRELHHIKLLELRVKAVRQILRSGMPNQDRFGCTTFLLQLSFNSFCSQQPSRWAYILLGTGRR